jgi:hypothetical protein
MLIRSIVSTMQRKPPVLEAALVDLRAHTASAARLVGYLDDGAGVFVLVVAGGVR